MRRTEAMNGDESRETRVKELIACCNEIIDRAEELIGSNEYSMGYTVSIELFPGRVPVINLERSIFPAKRFNEAGI